MSSEQNNTGDLNKPKGKNPREDHQKRKALSRRSYLLLAAAAILLLLAYFTFSGGGASYDGDLLAIELNLPYKAPDVPDGAARRAEQDPYYNYSKANPNYRLAIQDLKKLIEIDDDPQHKFYLGVSLLQIEKWKDAEKILENLELKTLKNYPLNFYLGISKIGQRKTKEAIEHMENPTSGQEPYNSEAEKAIRILKRKS